MVSRGSDRMFEVTGRLVGQIGIGLARTSGIRTLQG